MSDNTITTTAALRTRSGSSFVLPAGVLFTAPSSWPAGFIGAGSSALGYSHVVPAAVPAMLPATNVATDTRQAIAAKQARPPRGIPR